MLNIANNKIIFLLILSSFLLSLFYINNSSLNYAINKYSTYERNIIKIPLAFHTLPLNKLSEKFNETDNSKIKQKMEEIIDEMVICTNNIWKVAGILFLKARIFWEDAPEAPDSFHRAMLRKRVNEEYPLYYHIFLIDGPFPDWPMTQAITKEYYGTFLTYEAWTNDPNIPDDDNDPKNGWFGEEPPGEILAHELGHALGLLPGPKEKRATRHYRGIAFRDRLMHEDIPCGITLTYFDIIAARDSPLARKFKDYNE
ncbi:MAG: hypothetical protein QXF09_02825 [Nitrososphaerota archaeon]